MILANYSLQNSRLQPPIKSATGGIITYSGRRVIHTFTSSGTFTPSNAGVVEVLIVGGGGNVGGGVSGTTYNAGGGGGQVLERYNVKVTKEGLTVTVGTYGVDSSFNGVTAVKGNAGYTPAHGGASGSGNAGGAWSGSGYGGGGGGGNGGVGSANSGNVGGSGGIGTDSKMSGRTVTYGAGGKGGYGAGNFDGVQNTGQGGGGDGGQGRSGIVVISYESDIKFKPNDISGCALWVDAMQTAGTDGATLATIYDLSGNGNNLTQRSTGAVFVANGFNNRPVFRFDGARNYGFTEITGIRNVFWVIKEDSDVASDTYKFLLGHTTLYEFHRGSGKYIWNSTHAPKMFNGVTRLNGAVINGLTTNMPTTMSVLSVATSDSASANQFNSDRDIAGRYWDGDLGELIIYNRFLQTDEIASVENYLLNKWGLV